MQSRSSRQGFSLIEVAIAMVIFLIGALAIIKIFPGALNVIGNNGDQQIAMNLNRDVGARLKTDGSVPDATFNIAVNNDGTLHWTTENNTDHTADYTAPATPPTPTTIGNEGDIPASVLGIPRFNFSLPTTNDIETQSSNSALSRFRGILGEKSKVFKIGTDSYAETEFPISIQDVGGTPTPLPPTISQEYIVRNARIDKQGRVSFKDATADIAGQQVRLDDPANAPRDGLNDKSMLYISYRYFGNSGKIWGVSEEAVPVGAITLTDTATNVSVNPPTTTRGAIVGYDINSPNTTGTVTEVISVRVKRLVGPGVFPGTDDISRATAARCGLILLPSTITTDTVSIDYAADWSWLLQRATLSLTPDEARPVITDYSYRQLALGAPFIEDQVPYGVYSILQDPNDTANPLYASQFGTSKTNPDPMANNSGLMTPIESELRSGKLTFSVKNPPVPPIADTEPKARVAYKTRDSWAQQLSVAANSYKPFVEATTTFTPAEPWRDYYLGDDNYIYFYASEAGKTVNVSYTLATPTGDKPIVERPFVIDQQIIDTPSGVSTSFTDSKKVSRAQLTNFAGSFLTTAELVSIQAVQGNSVTMRTAYINGNKYAQTLLTSNRGTN